MRFAEVFLRLGCSLVAWMVVFTYVFWLAAAQAMSCGPDGAAMHKLLLGLAPIAVGAGLLLRVTRPFMDIHRLLVRLGIVLALLSPFVARNVWVAFSRTAIDGVSLCSEIPPATWQLLWAPLQLAALLLTAWIIVAEWRIVRIEKH